MDSLMCLKNIEKSYRKPILNLDYFNIGSGECILVSGDNGSGKSTLLKIINGLIDADNGNISYQNQQFLAKKSHPLSKNSVYLHTKTYLLNRSVEENIAYPLKIRNEMQQQKVEQALEWAGLKSLRKRYPNTLSSGEMQKVALARAYVINPKLWLLDEPTENLDKKAKVKLCKLLNQLLAQKHSVIIATHSKESFKKIPHTIFTLNDQNDNNG